MRFQTMTLIGFAALALAACSGGDDAELETPPAVPDAEAEATAPDAAEARIELTEAGPRLDAILAAQSDEAKARYQYRHPRETIEFFGIEPGMTVAEILPGGGWYSKILLPYLGDDGALIGIDYSVDMWSKFGGFATEEFLEGKQTWAETWVVDAVSNNWQANTMGSLNAFAFGSRNPALEGTVDVVMMVRALHHLNRFNTEDKNYMDEALADIHAVLKPGGILGIVQHRAPEGNDDAWANGDNGYLKESDVIEWVEAAGFTLVGDSDVNENPLDMPTNDDFVWRLPPTLGTSENDPELRAQMQAIGETDRMTLKFKKN